MDINPTLENLRLPIYNILVFLLFTISYSIGYSQSQVKTKEILNNMYDACKAATRFSSDLTKEERFDQQNKQRITKLSMKITTEPDLKINVVIIDSDAFGESGSELIFHSQKEMVVLKGWRSSIKGKYHNIYQDDIIRAKDKEHHAFSHLGFQYLTQILNYYQKVDSISFFKSIHLIEKPTYYEFTIDDTQYTEGLVYKVRYSGETIVSIADALHVNQFKVWELNKEKQIDYLTPLNISTMIRVPSSYARKTVLYINKINFLPLTQIIYDSNAKIPYEKYVFEKFKLTPPKFLDETFSYR